jgi:hypothetical protein
MFTNLLPVFPLLIDALTNHVIILHICREWCGFSTFFGFSVFRHSIFPPPVIPDLRSNIRDPV